METLPSEPLQHHSGVVALLPLVLLQKVAHDYTTYSVVDSLFVIECLRYTGDPTPDPACSRQPPQAVHDAASKDVFICIGVTIVSSILLSGLYSHHLDVGNRKRVMGVAAGLQFLGALWGVFALSYQSLFNVPSFFIVSLLQGFGGGEIVLRAATMVLAVDTPSTTRWSFNLALILVTQDISGLRELFARFEPRGSFVAALVCWIIYVFYLAVFLREAPPATRPPATQTDSEDTRDNDPDTENLGPATGSGHSLLLATLSIATVDPIKLVFHRGSPTLFWIGAVVFVMPTAEYFFSLFATLSVLAYHVHWEDDAIFTISHLVAKEASLLFVLPISAALYRYFRQPINSTPDTVDHEARGSPTERTRLLPEGVQPPSPETAVISEPSPSQSPDLLSICQDLFITRACFLVIVSASLFIFFGTTWKVLVSSFIIYRLGSAFRPAIQSLVSQAVDRSHLGRILTVLVVVETLGSVSLNPYFALFSELFAIEVPTPIVVVSICTFVVCGVIMGFLRPTGFIRIDGNT